MLACLGCFRLLTSHKWYDYAIAGVVVGVAVSSRYFNLSLAATLIVAHVLSGAHHEPGHWKRLIAGLVAIGFGFLITTPAFIFFVEQVFRSLQREARAPVIPLSILERLWWYLSFALPDALSWPIGLLAIVGAFLAQRARNKRAILLLVGSAAFLLTISAPRLYWQRWAAPLIPVSLLFAAGAFWTVVDRWKKQHPGFARWERPAAALLVIVLSLLPARESIRYLYTMTQPDTETLAAQWLAANAPPGSRIVREWSTAAIPSDDVSVTYSYFLSSLGPFDETLAHQYDYFVASSYAYEEFFQAAALRVENKESYEKQVEFYRQLFKNELVAQFDPDPWKTAGPTIKIYHMSGRSP
jgi:hypothetical protein